MRTLNYIRLSLLPLVIAGSAAQAGPPGGVIIDPNLPHPGLCNAVVDAPVPGGPTSVPEPQQCKRYNMTLDLSWSDPAAQQKYMARFPDNCFVTWTNNFACYFKTAQEACDAKVISHDQIAQFPKYEQPTTCSFNGTYYELLDAEGTSKAQISLTQQPLQASEAIAGPYSNLSDGTEPILPGRAIGCRASQVIAANQDHFHDGKVHSDLAGFLFPCPEGRGFCIEPDDITDKNPVVHQIVPRTDPRGCGLGTNSFANVAVMSSKLAAALGNEMPPAKAIEKLSMHFKY